MSNLEKHGQWLPHHPDKASLVRSEEAWCYICAAVREKLQRVQGSSDQYNRWMTIYRPYRYLKQEDVEEGAQHEGLLPRMAMSIAFDIADAKKDVRLNRTLADYPPIRNRNTGTEATLSLCRRWIKDCDRTHELCKFNRQGRKFPQRILEINHFDDSWCLRLPAAGTVDLQSNYMTVSHCWGKITPLKLVEHLFSELQQWQPFSRLPKSFQDAVLVTKFLGIKYLWIDALCIIQDSEEDWANQSARMSGVYTGSFCNISIAGASDSDGGCFNDRSISALRFPRVHLQGSEQEMPDVLIFNEDKMIAGVEDQPVNKRAWVVQERLLAPRKIHFGSSEVFWECQELMASESFPKEVPRDLYRQSNFNTTPNNMEDNRITDDTFELWMRIRAQYSSCNLTFAKDKLVAISGVIDLLQQLTGHSFIAGLWSSIIPYQLCWTASGVNRSPYDSYIAPSWSWASISGKIAWQEASILDYHTLIEVVEIQVEPAISTKPNGVLKGGFLTLEGGLLPISGLDDSGKPCVHMFDQPLSEFEIIWDDAEPQSYDEGSLYLLPITVSSNMSGFEGLLIRHIKGNRNSRNVFIRIGTFNNISVE
ncbi:uncharacterized protein KY384_005661 [Bacidia gigantensis]|uniref:uncharacterized protein n=1 Tax=Bacidia gigantensis TaxID=2732470 RepID=UPI001D0598CF|nr:uncharacterized protein KY384_005661 [Bacidia gigantensis]KAG8530178.1 hypothetical protein KY384_005661 [Bacidia gigantensis]